ncbi:MAG: hypothetical protein WBE11_18310, partial [Candidatus Aminicenantaceae bacterium]
MSFLLSCLVNAHYDILGLLTSSWNRTVSIKHTSLIPTTKVVDHVVLKVIKSFQDVSGWKLRKIEKDSRQGQKRIPYIYAIIL